MVFVYSVTLATVCIFTVQGCVLMLHTFVDAIYEPTCANAGWPFVMVLPTYGSNSCSQVAVRVPGQNLSRPRPTGMRQYIAYTL